MPVNNHLNKNQNGKGMLHEILTKNDMPTDNKIKNKKKPRVIWLSPRLCVCVYMCVCMGVCMGVCIIFCVICCTVL